MNLQVKFDFITFPGRVEGNIGKAEHPPKAFSKAAVRDGSPARKLPTSFTHANQPPAKKKWDFSLVSQTRPQNPGKSTRTTPEEALSILSGSDTSSPATNATQALPPASPWQPPSSNPLHSDMAQQLQVFEVSSSPRKVSSVSTASTHSLVDDEFVNQEIESQEAAFITTHRSPPDSPPPPPPPFPPPPPVPQQSVEGVKDARSATQWLLR